MTKDMTGEQRTMLIVEVLHAFVVLCIVAATLVAFFITPGQPTLGLLGSAVGGGLIYAHARASAVRGYMSRDHENGRSPPTG